MKFLVDHCAGRRLADWLKEQGHDVLEARALGPGPTDQVLLARAASERRVLVSLDKYFGQHVCDHEVMGAIFVDTCNRLLGEREISAAP